MFKRLSHKDKPPLDSAELCRGLCQWSGYGLGKNLMEEETEQLAKELPTLFGYYLLHVGAFCDNRHLEKSYITCKVVVDCQNNNHEYPVHLLSNGEKLPIATDSVDLVILQHSLEISTDPHGLLREVERVLLPEGHVIITGFNPWSLWGLRRLFSFSAKSMPWKGHFLSPFRVKDWLRLLGFDVLNVHTFFFKPPVKNHRLQTAMGFVENLGKKAWPAFGAAYIFVARKRVSTLTPIGPVLRKKKPVLQTGLIETRQRQKVQ